MQNLMQSNMRPGMEGVFVHLRRGKYASTCSFISKKSNCKLRWKGIRQLKKIASHHMAPGRRSVWDDDWHLEDKVKRVKNTAKAPTAELSIKPASFRPTQGLHVLSGLYPQVTAA
ncbi:hypothetical protein GN956_G14175 [Arapaima gigas]